MFFWILTWDDEGRYTLLGPFNSSPSAQKVADGLEYDYEIEKLPTMNKARATQLVKEALIEKNPAKFGQYVKTFRHRVKESEKVSEEEKVS